MNREIIIDRIITLSKKLNKTPTKKEYVKEYNNTEFSRYFKGSYTEALEAAGLKVNYNKNLTKEQVLEKYRKYISVHGMNFSSRNIPKGLPGADVISKKLWNGWNDFLEELGQEKNVNLFHKLSKEEMIKFLQEKIDLGIIKTSSDIYNNKDLPDIRSIRCVLKTDSLEKINKMLNRKLFNIKKKSEVTSIREKTTEELLDEYIQLSKKLNKTINGASFVDIKRYTNYSPISFSRRFVNMNKLRRAAGFEPLQNMDLYNREEVLEIVYNIYKQNNFKKLKWREILITNEISITVINKHLSNKIEEIYKIILEEKSRRK